MSRSCRSRVERTAMEQAIVSLFEDTNPRALKHLLAAIHNRTTVLPDFQRDFVWEPGATQELIVSIANNYPAGSILRVRDAQRVCIRPGTRGRKRLEVHLSVRVDVAPRTKRPRKAPLVADADMGCDGRRRGHGQRQDALTRTPEDSKRLAAHHRGGVR